MLKGISKNSNLIAVSCVRRGSLHRFIWKSFEAFVMEPLTERLVFSCVLHDFLGNDATPERSKR